MLGHELAAAVAVALGAFAQSITGIGFGLVSGPLLVLSLGPRNGVLVSILLGVVLNVMVLAKEGRRTDLRHVVTLFVPALASAPVAGVIAHRATPAQLSITAGVLVLIATGLLASGFRSRRLHGRVGAAGAGFTSGLLSALAGVGGPPVALYALNAGWDVAMLRPTLNCFFILTSIATFVVRGTPSISLSLLAWLAFAVAIGFFFGHRLVHRLRAEHVRRLILVIATAGGIAAIAKGVL